MMRRIRLEKEVLLLKNEAKVSPFYTLVLCCLIGRYSNNNSRIIVGDYSYFYCSRHVPIRWKPLRCNCIDYGNDRENNNFYSIATVR